MSEPEGATPLTDEEREGLRLPVSTHGELNAVEAANVLKGYGLHLGRRKPADARWLDEPFLRRVHKDMLGDVWEWAGTYRMTEKTVGVLTTQIALQLGQLLGDFRYWQEHPETMPALERAARLHHGLVRIHPFANGNGRHARLVADAYLHSQRHALPDWPVDLNAESGSRASYLKALRAADRGDFAPLLAYISALLPRP